MKTQQSEYYEPLPAQVVTIKSKKYGYEFSRLIFLQAMLAEERAQLKMDRLDYLQDNPAAGEAYADMDYRLDMASILFVPVEGKRFQEFNESARSEVRDAFAKAPIEAYQIVIGAITDFFTQRGSRNIASRTLLKQGSLKTLLKLSQLMASTKQSLSETASMKEANLAGESASEATTQQ